MKRLFTTCILHKERKDEYAFEYRLELFYDLNEHLQVNHSLRGNCSVSIIDMMLLSYVRRHMNIKVVNQGCLPSIKKATHFLECTNVKRLLDHLNYAFYIAYDRFDVSESNTIKEIQRKFQVCVFLDAVREGDIEKCRQILKQKPKKLYSKDASPYRENAGHLACQKKDLAMIKFLHQEHQFDFNKTNNNGISPLFLALDDQCFDISQYLIEECKVKFDMADGRQRTPLHMACGTNQMKIASYLIDKGADINSATGCGRTILSKACWNGHT